MASPSGTSSGSTLVQSSGSEEELQQLMDQRKRRRRMSNRESARRSRMKKQKHLDDLTAEVAQLTDKNNQIIMEINVATQLCLNIDGENYILRAQATELGRRLEALNEIIVFLNGGNGYFAAEEVIPGFESMNNPALELGRRLEALNEIIVFMNGGNGYFAAEEVIPGFESMNNPWTCPYLNQPVVFSAEMLQY